MGYVKPEAVVDNMIDAGVYKSGLNAKDLLIRGALSGSILGFATTLAVTASIQTGINLVGALLFPIGFVIIILLGLELVTGSFALLPMALFDKKITAKEMFINWNLVFLGNLIGALIYCFLYIASITKFGNITDSETIQAVVAIAESKTNGYMIYGLDGWFSAVVKGILCNWMVSLGAAMAMTSISTIGKISAMWLPILTFVALGYEHLVVNMFVIPAGIFLGADVSISNWWIWNQIPVTIGNVIGAIIFTASALYLTHKKKS